MKFGCASSAYQVAFACPVASTYLAASSVVDHTFVVDTDCMRLVACPCTTLALAAA